MPKPSPDFDVVTDTIPATPNVKHLAPLVNRIANQAAKLNNLMGDRAALQARMDALDQDITLAIDKLTMLTTATYGAL